MIFWAKILFIGLITIATTGKDWLTQVWNVNATTG